MIDSWRELGLHFRRGTDMTLRSYKVSKVIGRQFWIGAILISWFFSISQVNAVEWSAPNASEMATLPPYCEARLNEKSPNREMWSKTIGSSTFGSVHHYCFALNFMNRYSRTMGPERGTWLHFALDNFNYMLKNPDLKSPLVPEIYLNRAIALKFADRDAEAIQDFYKALELGPKQVRAYTGLADFFAAKGLTAKALEVVTEGLRQLPDNKALQRRYTELGGKLPYPEPFAKPEEKPTGESAVAPVESVESKDTTPVAEPSTVTPSLPTDDAPKAAPDIPLPATRQAQPVGDGAKKNPWCRFCPPE